MNKVIYFKSIQNSESYSSFPLHRVLQGKEVSKTQIPDFRHYDQKKSYSAEMHRAVLWVPRRTEADAYSFSTYAAKLLSGISRNNYAGKDSVFPDMWENPS